MMSEPIGINYIQPNHVIGIDCYWENNVPVNAKYWGWFKNMEDNIKDGFIYQALRGKPMAFSEDIIRDTFNPVYHMISNAVLRDSIFSFRSWVKRVDVLNVITLRWDEKNNSFILYLPSHERKQ